MSGRLSSRRLPAEIHDAYLQAFTHALQPVFQLAVPIAVVAFALTWFLKDQRLREKVEAIPME